MSSPSRVLRTAAVVAVTLSIGALTSCSSDASTRAGASNAGPSTTAAQVTVPQSIPKGTTLRIGDQLEYLQTALKLAGQDQRFDYKVKYSAFIGGPPMLQAFQGGSLDTGFVGSTPLIFAQAANQDIVAVASWGTQHGAGGVISADPDIKGWADLKGKRVAYQRGTAAEASLLQALDKVGLSEKDITTVDVPITQISAALKGGSADAGISTEPLISVYIAGNPGGTEVARASEITDRSSFLIANRRTLTDPAKTAALADYTSRLVRAFAFLAKHPEQVAQSVYVKQYGLTPTRAAEVVKANGPTSFVALPGAVEQQQQKLADLFLAAGQIHAKVDVSAEFDPRFNDLLRKVGSE
jgi:sulfonate transport system substrate-binding protein